MRGTHAILVNHAVEMICILRLALWKNRVPWVGRACADGEYNILVISISGPLQQGSLHRNHNPVLAAAINFCKKAANVT